MYNNFMLNPTQTQEEFSMKKFMAVLLTLSMVLVGCAALAEGVMTHADYVAAAIDSEIVVETYVQAKQSWWDNKHFLLPV